MRWATGCLAVLCAMAATAVAAHVAKVFVLHFDDPQQHATRWRAPRSDRELYTVQWILDQLSRCDTLPEGTVPEAVEVLDEIAGTYVPLTDDLAQAMMASPRPQHLLLRSRPSSPPQLVMIAGRRFDDQTDGLSIGGGVVRVQEQSAAELGTGLVTWDGSVVLAKFLDAHPELVRGKAVLEVGAGTGISGIAAALLGATRVALTDLPYALGNLRGNVARNLQLNPSLLHEEQLLVDHLDWADPRTYPPQHWDVVLGADVVWLRELVPPLVQVLAHYARAGATVYFAHQTRSLGTDALLFSTFEMQRLEARQVTPPPPILLPTHESDSLVQLPREELHPDFRASNIQLWALSARTDPQQTAICT